MPLLATGGRDDKQDVAYRHTDDLCPLFAVLETTVGLLYPIRVLDCWNGVREVDAVSQAISRSFRGIPFVLHRTAGYW